jgi:acyl-CoA thioesterase-1
MSLTIIAFGDSLTTGFIPTRIAHKPYTRFLKRHLENFCSQNSLTELSVHILNRGVNGNLTSDMLLRFRWDVLNAQPTHVIILGGTNDLGWELPVEEIFDNLTEMYTQACEHNITPVCCAVPSILGWDTGISPRIQLNAHIKRYCHKRRLQFVDLFTPTCDSQTKRLQGEYTSDGLHFNVLGYQKMADIIYYDAIQPLLITYIKTINDD